MALNQIGAITQNRSEVDIIQRTLTVTPRTQDANSVPTNIGGGERAVVEIDAGGITGSVLNQELNSQEFRKLQAAQSTIIFHDVFNGAAVNTANWNSVLSTMTQTEGVGKLTLNSGSSVAANTYDVVKSYRTFPVYSGFSSAVEFVASYQAAGNINNAVAELGIGYTATNTVTPTDGLFFRWSGGNFFCVQNNNGSETYSNNITPPTVNSVHLYRIVSGVETVEFWIDNILQATIIPPAAQGLPITTQDLPITFRVYNTATPPVSAVQLAIFSVNYYVPDFDNYRSYEIALAGIGGSSIQGQSGTGAFGTTANHTNSTAAVASGLSNTTAEYAKLGGRFLFASIAAAAVDYIVFAFQVGAGLAAVNVPGKTIYIRGIHISTMVGNQASAVAVSAVTPSVLQWFIGVGSSAVTLAQAEGAATKAPRILDLGMQYFPISSPIGYAPSDLDVQFSYPLMCEAGNYVHVGVCIPVGATTVNQDFQGTVIIDGVYE
jgi:hypothetical protein